VAVDHMQSRTAGSCFPRGWCVSLVNTTDVSVRGLNGPGVPLPCLVLLSESLQSPKMARPSQFCFFQIKLTPLTSA